MKKFFFLAAFLFAVILPGYAQIDVSIQKSEIFKDDRKHTELEFVEEDGQGGVVTIRMAVGGLMKRPKEYYVSHFDKNLNLVSEKTFEIEKNTFKGLMVKDGKVHILDFAYNRDTKAYDFKVWSSTLSAFDFTSQTLFSVDKEKIKKFFAAYIGFIPVFDTTDQIDNNSFGEVVFSKNKNFFAVNFDLKDRDHETHKVMVFNHKLEKVHEQLIKKNIKDRLFLYQNTQVDDVDGTVYLLGKAFENGRRTTKRKKKSNYHYELIKAAPDGQIKEINLKSDLFVASLTVAKNLDKLVCVGFYSERNDNRYKGVVRFDIDPQNLSVTKESFLPFDERFMFDKYGDEKDKELKDLSYRDIYIFENGDVILNAEEYFWTYHQNMNGGGYYKYYFRDIISCRVSADGNLLWARNINKNQVTTRATSNYASYCSMFNNDKLYFFINSRRVREKNDGRIKFKDRGDLYALTIDNSGNLDYKNIIEKPEVPYYVEYGKFIDQNNMILVGRDGRKKRLIRISPN